MQYEYIHRTDLYEWFQIGNEIYRKWNSKLILIYRAHGIYTLALHALP